MPQALPLPTMAPRRLSHGAVLDSTVAPIIVTAAHIMAVPTTAAGVGRPTARLTRMPGITTEHVALPTGTMARAARVAGAAVRQIGTTDLAALMATAGARRTGIMGRAVLKAGAEVPQTGVVDPAPGAVRAGVPGRFAGESIAQ